MKALTIWQPWATLIMAGAKPFEFRGWPAPSWIIDEDVVIHAGSRAIRSKEVEDLIERLGDDRTAWTTGLFGEKAMPILERALAQSKWRAPKVPKRDAAGLFPDLPPIHVDCPMRCLPVHPLPMAAGLGLVRIGRPVNGNETAETFGHRINDSDRIEHAQWGWPMLEVRPFAEPVYCKGAQGFWTWPDAERMANDAR